MLIKKGVSLPIRFSTTPGLPTKFVYDFKQEQIAIVEMKNELHEVNMSPNKGQIFETIYLLSLRLISLDPLFHNGLVLD